MSTSRRYPLYRRPHKSKTATFRSAEAKVLRRRDGWIDRVTGADQALLVPRSAPTDLFLTSRGRTCLLGTPCSQSTPGYPCESVCERGSAGEKGGATLGVQAAPGATCMDLFSAWLPTVGIVLPRARACDDAGIGGAKRRAADRLQERGGRSRPFPGSVWGDSGCVLVSSRRVSHRESYSMALFLLRRAARVARPAAIGRGAIAGDARGGGSVSFFVLPAYVAFEAARDLLFLDSEPDQSIVGLVLAALSLTVMPCLAWAKRRTADHLHSPTLRTDATETLLCSWLSAALLGGLVLNARADHSGRQRGQVPQPRWRRRGRILLIGRG